MVKEFAQLNLEGTYTYADYLGWLFAERVELIKGKVFKMSPAPNRMHQTLSGKLFISLSGYFVGKPCKVYYAPFDVRFPRKSKLDNDIITVLQPDICVVCDESKLDEKGCIGAPDIVVEVLSPGNNAKEVKRKYEIYEDAGVQEFWLVSPQDHTFLMYTLIDKKYFPSRLMVEGDVVTSTVLPGFSLDLEAFFS